MRSLRRERWTFMIKELIDASLRMSDENTIIHILVPPAHAHSHSAFLANTLSTQSILWLDTLGDSIRSDIDNPRIHYALTFDLPTVTHTLQQSSEINWDVLVIDNISSLFIPLLSSTQGHSVLVDFMRSIQRFSQPKRIILINTSLSLAGNPTFNLLIDASLHIREESTRGQYAYIVQKSSMHPPGPLTRPLWEL